MVSGYMMECALMQHLVPQNGESSQGEGLLFREPVAAHTYSRPAWRSPSHSFRGPTAQRPEGAGV